MRAANDQADLALELLSTLSCRVSGATLRRVRRLQLRLTLSARYAFLWLRAFRDSDYEEAMPLVERVYPFDDVLFQELESSDSSPVIDAEVEVSHLRQVGS